MRYFIYCRKSSEGEERQVLSLASQQQALARAFTDNPEIEIVGLYEESKSAKTPGRPLFAEMLERIRAGEADGIASWAPDRLARNSIDGGHIIYLLDQGTLRDLKFATYTFENNPQGKFMLGIMFNQSKYYSDALSENVKRGNATKVAMGWRPNRPPIGYVNCPTTRTIVPDPELFPLVRKMFDLLLREDCSPREITLIARDEWGLRTRKRRIRGGTPLTLSAVYKLFANPFYVGQFVWRGEIYAGKHVPMVSPSEFSHVQQILKRTGKARPQKHRFPFTGLIRCGSCEFMVTAETKRNAYNSLYTYYHCTRRGIGPRCPEPAATADQVQEAFAAFLRSLSIPAAIEAWVRDRLLQEEEEDAATEQAAAQAKATIADLTAQLQELNRLRIRCMIEDGDYVAERSCLTAERDRLIEYTQSDERPGRFELFEHVVSFSNHAVEWFLDSDPATQRMIVKTAGSNFSMSAKILSSEAIKPFQRSTEIGPNLLQCGVGDDVRTKAATVKRGRALLDEIKLLASSGEAKGLLENLQAIHSRFGHPVGGGGTAIRKGSDRVRGDFGHGVQPPPDPR